MKITNSPTLVTSKKKDVSFNGYVYKTASIGIGRLAGTAPVVTINFTDDLFHRKLREKAFLKKVVRELKTKLAETKEQYQSLGSISNFFQKRELAKSIAAQELVLEDKKGCVAATRDIAQKNKQKLQQELFTRTNSGYTVFTPGEQGLSTTYKLVLGKEREDELLVTIHDTKLPQRTDYEDRDERIEKGQTLKDHIFNIVYNFDLIQSRHEFETTKTIKIQGLNGESKAYLASDILKYIAGREEKILSRFGNVESIPPKEIPESYQRHF